MLCLIENKNIFVQIFKQITFDFFHRFLGQHMFLQKMLLIQ